MEPMNKTLKILVRRISEEEQNEALREFREGGEDSQFVCLQYRVPILFLNSDKHRTYASGTRNMLRLLLEDDVSEIPDEFLMQPVLSAEFLLYSPLKEKGFTPEIMDECWIELAQPLLEDFLRAEPKIIFIIGEPMKGAFFRNEFEQYEESMTAPAGTIYPVSEGYDYGTPAFARDRDCRIVFIDNPLEDWEGCQNAVQILKERAKNDPIIREALDNAKRIIKKKVQEDEARD